MRQMLVSAGTMVLILACGGFARAGETVRWATLWGSHSLNKVARTSAPDSDRPGPVRLAGARGETVSGQAVFRSTADLPDATVSISDLRHRDSGVTISAGAIGLQWVRYIDVDRNTGGIPDDELVAKAPTSIADPFWEGSTIGVEAGRSQPVWIEIRVPRRAKAGDYEGKLAAAREVEVATVHLRVINDVLRNPASWHNLGEHQAVPLREHGEPSSWTSSSRSKTKSSSPSIPTMDSSTRSSKRS